MGEIVQVRYAAGRAEVEVNGRRLAVERRDAAERASNCPLELISVALGS